MTKAKEGTLEAMKDTNRAVPGTLTLGKLAEQVKALLEQGVDPNTPIYSEGCDCTGEADELVYTAENQIYPARIELTRLYPG